MTLQIAKINQSLTTAEQMRHQTQLIMQPYANWEEYLSPAPLSIAILGELVYISSQTDFSINKNPPTGGFKYIKYPESFRACLMQVCNSGWWAFNEAHKNMDQIRLHTLNVPDYMKNAVKILFQDNDEIVQAHLPAQLENISVVADECLALASATEKGFSDVINIIQELLEASVNTQKCYVEDIELINKKLEEYKLRKESSEEAVKRSEKAVKVLEEQLNEAHDTYKKAMDSLPSGWELLGMNAVEGLTASVSGLINGLTFFTVNPINRMCTVYRMCTNKMIQRGQDKTEDAFAEINIYSKSAEILKCAESLQQFVNKKDNIQWNDLYDQKNKRPKSDFSSDQLKRIKASLEELPQCKPKNDAQKICEEGIDICNKLAKYAPTGKYNNAKTKELIARIRNLIQSAHRFDSKSKNITNSPALFPKPPLMFKEENKSEEQTASQRASERASENAHFRIEQSRAQLDKTREMFEKSVENMEKNYKELTEILIEMRNCELKEIDFTTTIKMLVKGMDAMGRVKEQWEKMVRFFQMVSNIVKTSLTVSLKHFVCTSEKTQSLSYNGKLFSKDLLYNQAFQATNIANLVHMISGTYTEVSDKHLMDRISSLGKLMAMDKEKPEFKLERQKLQNSCDIAQKAILQLVQNNKIEFERKTRSRLETIDRELLAILPSAPPEERKNIQAAVKSGFKEDEEEMEEGYI